MILKDIPDFLIKKVSQFDPFISISKLTKTNLRKNKVQTNIVSKEKKTFSEASEDNVNNLPREVTTLQFPVYTKEEMIQIQADAYYIALKRLKDEEKKEEELSKKQTASPKRFSKDWWLNSIAMILVFFFPFKIPKRLSNNQKNVHHYVILITSITLISFGFLMYITGFISIVYAIFEKRAIMKYITLGILMVTFGDLTIFVGKNTTNIKDENKIYAFSSSIFAMLSMIIGIIF